MKIIFVDTCADCPFFRARGKSAAELYYCNQNIKGITDIGSIPNWCPLPNASQPSNSADVKNPGKCNRDYVGAGFMYCPDCGTKHR